MAKKVTVSLIDDFDGKQADGTVQFGLDGVSYEIDLSEKNAKKMREGLRPWVDAGRESEDLGGGAQSARAAYQLTASKAPKFVNGHAKAVMRSPAAAGCISCTRPVRAGATTTRWACSRIAAVIRCGRPRG